MGAFRLVLPVEPKKDAWPKAKTPPSAPASQYPGPVGLLAMATTPARNSSAAPEPRAGAAPKVRTEFGSGVVGVLPANVAPLKPAKSTAPSAAASRQRGGEAVRRRLRRIRCWALRSRRAAGRGV